jgi:two-component system, OmpR family, response regulator ResD
MLRNKTILIVDNEPNIRIPLRDFLVKEGYNVLEAIDGKQALKSFYEEVGKLNMILLDINIPVYDGWTVCREIRRDSDIPIIILTSRCEEFDEVHGFEVGADDYVKKPIKPAVLTARIEAFFRRVDKDRDKDKLYIFKELEIEDNAHVVKVRNEAVTLSPTEYSLLICLIQNSNRIISREQLLKQVWGYNYYGGLRTVDTHINRLRMKLGIMGNSILTVRGFGYKFEAK